jgi:hypothetical protein
MRRFAAWGLGLVLVVVAHGCDSNGGDPLTVDATGAVTGAVWLDRNGNAMLDGTDGSVGGVRVTLVPSSGGSAAYSAQATGGGIFHIDDVLVGDYRAEVDASTVADSLRVLGVDSARVTVTAGDTVPVLVGLTYPALTTDSARILPPESPVFVEGLVLMRWNLFGDQAIHVRDTTGAIRAIRALPTAVAPGDSVRLYGTTTVQLGRPVLKDVQTFLLRTGVQSPDPDTITTAQAASAAGGDLDAALVHLDSAIIQDTTRNSLGERVFIVDDGSGPAEVVLDGNVSIQLQFGQEVIGTILQVTGVLVPEAAGGDWQVKPRSRADIVIGALSWPDVTVSEARAEPSGTRLIVTGRALNDWATFGDSTVHVRDATGAIRAVRVPALAIAIGDSLRLVATIADILGDPVLDQVVPTLVATGLAAPAAVPTTTAAAANPTVDLRAELVAIAGATIQDTTMNAAGEPIITVDDGSGPLDVLFDEDVPFQLQFPRDINNNPIILGSTMDVTGLLTPDPDNAGSWLLKPRRNADVVIQ